MFSMVGNYGYSRHLLFSSFRPCRFVLGLSLFRVFTLEVSPSHFVLSYFRHIDVSRSITQSGPAASSPAITLTFHLASYFVQGICMYLRSFNSCLMRIIKKRTSSRHSSYQVVYLMNEHTAFEVLNNGQLHVGST